MPNRLAVLSVGWCFVCEGISVWKTRYNSSSKMMGYGDCMDKLKEYVDALEKELRKIEVFHRELPLAVRLVRHGNHNLLVFMAFSLDSCDCSLFEA